MSAVIETLYPESDMPDSLDRAAADHEAYAASRRRVYIGRSEYIERLDAHATGDGPPLVVLGESGGGKSALLANWTHRRCEQHSETPVLVHFIGAAPESADWMALLRRLLGEFQRRFAIQIEIPDQPDKLRMAFANALHMVAARGRVVLARDESGTARRLPFEVCVEILGPFRGVPHRAVIKHSPEGRTQVNLPPVQRASEIGR